MQVSVLGPLEVVHGGTVVPVGGARLRAVLTRLALDAGRAVSADALAAAVWPTRAGDDSRHALHSLLTRLRAALPDPGVLCSVGGGYRLDVPADAVDAIRFERLVDAGRAALRSGRPDVAARGLRTALDLWRGDALADVPDTPYAAAAAARLDELRRTADEDRAQAELETGADPGVLVAELTALTAAYPDRERAHALLLRALHADGRTAEALQHYARVRVDLAERLGTDPSRELRAAHLAVLGGDRPRRRRGNLRAPLTSFVGRQQERELVVDRLASGRLVTLTGAGGVGKTRLAATVAADLAAGLGGGAWVVELAPLTEPGELARCVRDTLGAPGAGAGLVGLLSPSPTLLVLDNAEHLLDAVAALALELLGRCPALRVLVTSREPLGVPGEVLVPVPPLPVAARTATVEEMRAGPAVRLFADRAAAVDPGFTVTTANAPGIAAVCRRLDGLPLAIELAAARVRTMPVEHLATTSDDRFALLSSGNRAALPRHRTLAAVVAWSWDLLTEDERTLAEAVSVFPGTITPGAAQEVAPGTTPIHVRLAGLADKSLLEPVDGPGVRFRMPETIREYGVRRLGDRADEARTAHARHVLGVVEAAAAELRGPGQLHRLPGLVAERDNLLGALHVAVRSGDAATAVRLASAMSFPLTLHGDHAGAARLLRTALDLPGGAEPQRAPAVAHYLLNSLLAGSRPEGLDALRPASGTSHPSAYAVAPLITAVGGGPGFDALPPEPPAHTTPWGRAAFWLLRALLREHDGDLRSTGHDLETAAARFGDIGERWGLATSLTRLGEVRLLLGDAAGAVEVLRRARRPAHELGHDHRQRIALAVAYEHGGDPAAARAELHAVLSGDPPTHDLALALLCRGDLDRRAGDPVAAASTYEHAGHVAALDGEPDRTFDARHRASRALSAVARGECAAAAEDLRAAPGGGAPTGIALATLRAAQGDPAAAAVVLGATHRLRGGADALNPDVVGLTGDLWQLLGVGLEAHYERGRRLRRSDATALLDVELGRTERR